MYQNPSDTAARKRERKPVVNTVTAIVAVPLFFAYFTMWRNPVFSWLKANGIFPQYGIDQFIDGSSIVDHDRALVSGLAGMLFAVSGYMIGTAIAKVVVR
ncbi:hypothetical protein [Yoonia sp. 2307UL14-13]|uniref:hypothetical protein n=1 Tax=Yoonia sp. 2307UL14-13 TaxID=3126506 RepID=UPI0030B39EF0